MPKLLFKLIQQLGFFGLLLIVVILFGLGSLPGDRQISGFIYSERGVVRLHKAQKLAQQSVGYVSYTQLLDCTQREKDIELSSSK